MHFNKDRSKWQYAAKCGYDARLHEPTEYSMKQRINRTKDKQITNKQQITANR